MTSLPRPARPRSARLRRGLTLLECVVALTLVTTIAVSVLGMRAEVTRAGTRAADGVVDDAMAERLFELARHGALGDPAADAEGRMVWRVADPVALVVRAAVEVEDPVDPSSRVTVQRYDIEIEGESWTFEWVR